MGVQNNPPPLSPQPTRQTERKLPPSGSRGKGGFLDPCPAPSPLCTAVDVLCRERQPGTTDEIQRGDYGAAFMSGLYRSPDNTRATAELSLINVTAECILWA